MVECPAFLAEVHHPYWKDTGGFGLAGTWIGLLLRNLLLSHSRGTQELPRKNFLLPLGLQLLVAVELGPRVGPDRAELGFGWVEGQRAGGGPGISWLWFSFSFFELRSASVYWLSERHRGGRRKLRPWWWHRVQHPYLLWVLGELCPPACTC